MASCANCGRRLPKQSRFCPECGQPVGEGDTKVQELPPDETGPVPVHVQRAEPRWFGVTPPSFLLGDGPAGLRALVPESELELPELKGLEPRGGIEPVAERGEGERRHGHKVLRLVL